MINSLTTNKQKLMVLVLAGIIAVFWLYVGISGVADDEVVYRVEKLSRGELVNTVAASGKLQAVVAVDVGTQVSGLVKTLHVDFNSQVKAGQVIAEIDAAPFEANLSQARAELEVAQARVSMEEAALQGLQAELSGLQASLKEAESDLKRKRSLKSRSSVSSSAVDAALAKREKASAQLLAGQARLAEQKAQIQLARAQAQQKSVAVEQRKLDLEYTFIRSPIDGVVISRNVDAGQTVAASLQTPVLFSIAQDLTNMQVSISVDEADIGSLREGQKVQFNVDTYPQKTFAGRVKQIRKAGQQVSNVVSYTVIATANNDELLLLPGMTANVTIVVAELQDVLKIPNAAFFYKPWSSEEMRTRRDSRVWVLDDDGNAQPIGIKYGATDGSASEVVSGELKAGQQIITGVIKSTPDR